MSSNDNSAIIEDSEIAEEQVREYLKQHGDFLQHNPDLLDHLHVSHASGSAVSLVEKQVSVLRERNIEMRRRLNSLTANARDNERLYEKTRELLLKLLEAESLQELNDAFHRSMKKDFEVEFASFILFGDKGDADGKLRFESLDSARIEIGALTKGGKAMCGALRKEELTFLFPDAGDVGSAALMPLKGKAEDLGAIAVGSSDAQHYSSAMGTLFLGHIGEIMQRLIPRLPRT